MADGECSVMKEIAKTEEEIKSTFARLENIEKRLQSDKLPENKQQLLRRELEEVRKLLETNESQLAHLRTHNRKTFVFAAAVMFVFFTVYMLYILVQGPSF